MSDFGSSVELPVGTDGGVPIKSPDNSLWEIWAYQNLWLGAAGTNKYIPKVNDYVCDYTINQWWRVALIDPVTYVPTLVPLTTTPNAAMTAGDLLQGVGPGTLADTFRVYLDTSVIPFILAVDGRLWYPGPDVASVKLFTGSDFTTNENCISGYYDQSGKLVSQAIPLMPVSVEFPDGSMGTVSGVPVCYTNVRLADATPVTAVAYSSTGAVISIRQLLIQNTGCIRLADSGVKYVVGIELRTPFLSSSDPTLIQFPINVILANLNLMGIVRYSDGSSAMLPVDNTKFQILGFNAFVSTIVGQSFTVVLKYNLSPDEAVFNANSVEQQGFITRAYRMTSINSAGAYALKLFAFPVWRDSITGYRLDWFLYNLDRSTWWNVTSLVQFSPAFPAFQPLQYGVQQDINAQVQLNKVDPGFTNYLFSATLAITLLGPGMQDSPWQIQFEPGQMPPYGPGNVAAVNEVQANQYTINIASGYKKQGDWLQALYYNTLPLTDPANEAKLPVPSHFAIQMPGGENSGSAPIVCPISQWASTFSTSVAIPDDSTLYVTFFLRTTTNDLQLSICGLPVRYPGT
jgi:hypothetical protein